MRILFFALLALLVYLVWRGSRAGKRPGTPPVDGDATPQTMLRCSVCSTHVPAMDAVKGRLGIYCSPEHRDQKEG